MTKLAPEWVRTSDPVIRSPARYRWTTAPAWEECGGDGVVVPVDYDCVCDDFAEAASLAEHAGGVIVDWAPPAGTGSVFTDDTSCVEQ